MIEKSNNEFWTDILTVGKKGINNLCEYPKSSILYLSFLLMLIFSESQKIFVLPPTDKALLILIGGSFIFLVLKYRKNFFEKNFLYVFFLIHVIFSVILIYNMYSIKIRELDLCFFPTFAGFVYLLSLAKWYSKQFVIKISNCMFFLYIIGILVASFINSLLVMILFIVLSIAHTIFMLLFLIFSSSKKNSDKLENSQSIYLFALGGISYPIVFLYLITL